MCVCEGGRERERERRKIGRETERRRKQEREREGGRSKEIKGGGNSKRDIIIKKRHSQHRYYVTHV